MEIKFAPHALDDLEKDLDTKDLQEFLDELKAKMDDGSFFEDSEPVDLELMKEEEPELYAELIKSIEDLEDMDKKLN